MKKLILTALIIVAAIAILLGLWWWLGGLAQQSSPSATTPEQSAASQRTDLTASNKVAITMRDLSFSPANITVKVGTVVTWTNDETIGHDIIADDPANAGGLPTSRHILGKGEATSVTFLQLGLFRYHCGVHDFMHGSVE